MFIIFNYVGIALCVLAVFGGWMVKFSVWALGLSKSFEELGFIAATCAAATFLDIACRTTGIVNSSPGGWLRFLAPSTGGQIFFVPIWILATGLLAFEVIRTLV